MSLVGGARLGPYEILSPLGAGGMGEVYKARDTRLDRTVAIKILPPRFSEDADMKQRFEREAKAISALAHVNICALYDVGTHEGTEYLVMEHLEGQTLAERLLNGPLPPDQLLKVSIEITAALGSAHHAGIVHRDLKPGNIMLTKSGVKLLDFGLAKATAQPVRTSSSTSLPTELPKGLTQQGTILGTFQYMAPEQLEGKEADARSDIFSFGAVLYEMATGRKAFEGKSHAALISAILKDEPTPISTVAPMTPPALDRVVKTCLAKDQEDRFQTAHDIKLQLQWIAEGGSQVGLPAPVAQRRKSRERLAWGLAATAAVAAAILGVGFVRRAPARPRLVRFEIANPEGITAIDAPRISPDGRHLAFNATDSSGKSRIWVRALNALVVQPLALAYQSNESGRNEVYVQSFPGPGGKWQISASGGVEPRWRADGKELYYRAPDQRLMAVDIQAGSGFAAGVPQPLFLGRFDVAIVRNRYLPTADGRRFLTVAPLGREAMTPTTVVLNWFAELGR